MAPPKRQLTDKEIKQIEGYARVWAPDETIAILMDIPERTLRRQFGRLLKRWRQEGATTLRARQFQLAMGLPGSPAEFLKDAAGNPVFDAKGNPVKVRAEVAAIPPNPTMQIWVGKQILMQKENPDNVDGSTAYKPVLTVCVKQNDGSKSEISAEFRESLKQHYNK